MEGGRPVELAATTTEYVHIDVTPPSGVSLAAAPVKIAIVAHGGNPAPGDWHTATWDNNTARLKVGPEGGALTLAVGGYWVWISFTVGGETPVRRSGRIRVY